MLNVVRMSLWPMRRLTCRAFAPSEIMKAAAVWRSSWKSNGGDPRRLRRTRPNAVPEVVVAEEASPG
jgi:hypothetical protein